MAPPSRIDRRAFVASSLAALAGGCSVPSFRPISFWAMSTEGENAPLVTAGFTRETGIAVDVQSLPWTAAHEKILTAFAGGSLPDVLMVATQWTAELATIGAIVPVPPPARRLLDDQFPGVVAQARVSGRDHAVPWVIGTQAQFYRRDLLAAAGHAAPPTRWAEWKAACHALKRRNPGGYAVLMLLNWPEHLFAFAAQQPDRLLRDRDARGNFSSPGVREALGLYRSIFAEGLAPPVLSTEIADPLTLFAQGWFAIYPAPPYAVGDLSRRAADLPRDRWAVAPLPGPAGPANGVVAANCLAVSATARDPARAWALVDYLCRPATQRRFHRITGDLPSRPSAWRTAGLAGDPASEVFHAQIERATPQPNVPEWQRIVDEVQLVAERMVRGDLGVDAAAAEMDRRADALLAKRRWLLDRGRIA